MAGQGPSLDQIITLLGAASPFSIMTAMWFLERKERIRLQSVVEGFLPTAKSLARSNRALTKVISGEDIT